MELIIQIISTVYNFLWGDLFTIPLPGGGSAGNAPADSDDFTPIDSDDDLPF